MPDLTQPPIDCHVIALTAEDLDTLFECVRITRLLCDTHGSQLPSMTDTMVSENLKQLERLLMTADRGVAS
jgi:hypothetical protein